MGSERPRLGKMWATSPSSPPERPLAPSAVRALRKHQLQETALVPITDKFNGGVGFRPGWIQGLKWCYHGLAFLLPQLRGRPGPALPLAHPPRQFHWEAVPQPPWDTLIGGSGLAGRWGRSQDLRVSGERGLSRRGVWAWGRRSLSHPAHLL